MTSASESTRTERATPSVALLRALWFALIPAELAALTLRYLRPDGAEGAGWAVALGGAIHEHGIWFLVGLFVLFSALARYWLRGWARRLKLDAPQGSLRRSYVVGTLALAGVAAVLAASLRAAVAEPFRVHGVSMLPTLEPGDYVLVKKGALPASAKGERGAALGLARGEVVVLGRGSERHVKRVIGLPGDRVTAGNTVSINAWQVPSCDAGRYFRFVDGRFVDGRLAVEFLDQAAYLTLLLTGDFRAPPVERTVQAGELFVLGDDRGLSLDSRAWADSASAAKLGDVMGPVERVLARESASSPLGWQHYFKRLGLDVQSEGIDVRPLEEGIRHCLARRPPQTHPPEAGASVQAAAGLP